jgi:Spy/CpxP family protein refolding chaperone
MRKTILTAAACAATVLSFSGAAVANPVPPAHPTEHPKDGDHKEGEHKDGEHKEGEHKPHG